MSDREVSWLQWLATVGLAVLLLLVAWRFWPEALR
jgi:hypothetical protein